MNHPSDPKPSYFQYLLIVALLLFMGFQQTQIASLKTRYKKLDADRFELASRVNNLELQNGQLLTALKQIDSRVGYMDSKVEGVIEENVQKAQQYRAASQAPNNAPRETSPTPDNPPPDDSGAGLFDKIRHFFEY